MQRFANPAIFMSYSASVLPWLTRIVVALFILGLGLSFFFADPDYQQKETVLIMFIHVPCAWLGMMGYTIMAISGAGSLIWRHPLADVSVKAAAPIGAAFTFLALVTGAIWGKPTWGTYWVWDARLTSMLILFILYIGVMAIWMAIDDISQAGKAAAVLAIVGFVNVPIIKFSVNWWFTLHQGASVMRTGGSTIYWTMLLPLLTMAIAFTLLFVLLHVMAMRNEIMRRRVEAIRLAEIERHAMAE